MTRVTLPAFLALLLVLPVSGGTQDGPPPRPDGPPRDPSLQGNLDDHDILEKAVARAIDKGVEWLKKQQKSEGNWPPAPADAPTYGGGGNVHPNKVGNTALALLALLKSEVDPDDPIIVKGFDFIYKYLPNKGNARSTYEEAVTLMAIEARCEAGVLKVMKKRGEKTTERAGDFKEPKYSLSGPVLGVANSLVNELRKDQTKKGGWRYGEGFGIVGSDEDVSATQIVLLGLKSATRMKVPVDPRIFEKAMQFLMDSQEKDGPKVDRPVEMVGGGRGTYASSGNDRARGWAYELKSDNPAETTVTGGMTCAGIGGMLICKSAIDKMLSKAGKVKAEQSINDGVAWLYSNWTVEANPEEKGRTHHRSHYYYLYGIERVGAMSLYERIGKHVWFKEGAQYLVRAQYSDGHWTDREVAPEDLFATCFALLFLKKGTVPIGDVMTGDTTRYKGGENPPVPQPIPSSSPSPSPDGGEPR